MNINEIARLAYGIFKNKSERSYRFREMMNRNDLDMGDQFVMAEMGGIDSVIKKLRGQRPDHIYEAIKAVGEGSLWAMVESMGGAFLTACLKVAHPNKDWEELAILYTGKNDTDNVFIALLNEALEPFENKQTVTFDEESRLSAFLRTALINLPYNEIIFEVEYNNDPTVLQHLNFSIGELEENLPSYVEAVKHQDIAEFYERSIVQLKSIRERIAKVSDRHAMFAQPFTLTADLFAAHEMFRLEKIIKWDGDSFAADGSRPSEGQAMAGLVFD
jgi:hypothetical protein